MVMTASESMVGREAGKGWCPPHAKGGAEEEQADGLVYLLLFPVWIGRISFQRDCLGQHELA